MLRIRRLAAPAIFFALFLFAQQQESTVHSVRLDLPPTVSTDEQKAFVETLVLFTIFFVLSQFLKPKPKIENARPAGLGDFKFPTATEGRPVSLIWGTVKVEGPNVVWYGDLRQQPITEKIKTGLFSSTRVIRGYKYYIGMQMAVCRGGTFPVQSLLRIWVGDEVLWTGNVTADGTAIDIDEPEFLGGEDLGQGGIVGRLRFYSGSTTQAAASYLTTQQSVGGVTPTYRGTCYLLWEQGWLGNSTSIAPWAFELRRIPNGLGLATPSVNSGNDANPMNVIYEILTNAEWGLGLPAADIDTSNFSAAAETLRTEGNGFSFVLDSEIEAAELLREIERQIDGVIYLDRSSGKWKCNLARGGYSVPSLTAINQSNILEIRSFGRSTWDDTTNNVLVKLSNRALDYKETYAGAQDMANIRLQGNKIVSVEKIYPGVKDAACANAIAWRDLRLLSSPIARAELVVNRTLYDKNIGDVIRWSDSDLGITDLSMRITKIDLGRFDDGQISVSLVEDIFVFDAGVFQAPGATNWVPPPQTVSAIPTSDSIVIEAPRKFCTLDEEQPSVFNRIWAGARFQNDAASLMDIVTRPGSGSYTDAGDVAGFLVAGELASGINESGTQGSISINVDADLDSLSLLIAAMTPSVTAEDVGTRLANLVLIDNEFFAFRAATTGSGQLQLSSGYRGLLDSTPAAHAANARVWILLGNLTERVFTPGTLVNVKLLPRSATQSLPEGSATAINVTMSNRADCPYPPVALRFNTTLYPTGNVDLDSSGSGGPGTGLDDRGIAVSFVRRDFRNGDEAKAVVDETSLPADFPAANTTEYAVEVRNDPSGSNTLLFTTAYQSTVPIEISRTRILRYAGSLPSRLRMTVLTRHTKDTVLRSSIQNPRWDFNVQSSLISGDFNFGVRANGASSAAYVTVSTGTHTLNIGTALGTGNVEVSINSGAFSTVITAGLTTGTFSANAGDSIVVRHTQPGANTSETFVELTFGGTSVAYGVFSY
jgi:hypothetical protein